MASITEQISNATSFLIEPSDTPVDLGTIQTPTGSAQDQAVILGIVTGEFDDLSRSQFKTALVDENIGGAGAEGEVFTRDNPIGRFLGTAE